MNIDKLNPLALLGSTHRVTGWDERTINQRAQMEKNKSVVAQAFQPVPNYETIANNGKDFFTAYMEIKNNQGNPTGYTG